MLLNKETHKALSHSHRLEVTHFGPKSMNMLNFLI